MSKASLRAGFFISPALSPMASFKPNVYPTNNITKPFISVEFRTREESAQREGGAATAIFLSTSRNDTA
jgi:hypothetical protein